MFCSTKTELQELREQLRMYEVLSQCSNVVVTGVQTSQPSGSALDDSYAQLAIKRQGQTVQQSAAAATDRLSS